MKQNVVLYLIIVALVAGGLGFYGGTLYAGNSRGADNGLAARNRQMGRGGFLNNGVSVVRGTVSKQDSQSLTVALRDGSSKVVLLNGATVDKTVAGSVSDITSGAEVMVIGKTNSDGSVTAQTVQLNPLNGPGNGGQGQGRPAPTGK